MRKIDDMRASMMIYRDDTENLYLVVNENGEFLKWNKDFEYDASKKIEWYLKADEE